MQPPVFRSTYFHSDEHQSLTKNQQNGMESSNEIQNNNNINENSLLYHYPRFNDLINEQVENQRNKKIKYAKIFITILVLLAICFVLNLYFKKGDHDHQSQKQANQYQTKIQVLTSTHIESKFDHNQNNDEINKQQLDQSNVQILKSGSDNDLTGQKTLQGKIQQLTLPQQQLPQIITQVTLTNTQLQQSDQKAPSSLTQNDQQQDDQFQLSFVQTQFQGKQTEQTLAAAAFAKMESQINKLNKIEESNLQDFLQRKKLLQDISTLQVMIPDSPVQNYIAKDFYHFSVSIQQMILNSELQKMYKNGQTIFKISLKQHMRAIIRTQLVHNVNFKGQVQVNLSPFDKGEQQKRTAIKEIIQDQQLYYESLYQLSKYNNDQLRFCLVIPSYNNVKSKLYLRNLDSIFMQDYQNYHVVYVDDASPDHTRNYVQNYIKEKKIPQQKIKVIINQKNQKALYNIYTAIHSHCPDGQIVGLIDGDDSLLGRKVLQLYNAVYQSKKTALIYSNFLKILTNNKTSFGFGTQITKSQFRQGKLRNDLSLVGTHFMTFFSDVFKKIHKDDLCYENGTFYDYAYDRAIITPLIQMAYPRVQYLPEVTYEYRNDTGINDGTEDWERVSRIIMRQQPYEMLQHFPFIDDFIEEKEQKLQRQNKKIRKQTPNLKNNKQQLPKSYFKQDDEEEDQQQQD